MPSTATITAFYSFTANTKARASYVNTNFSNFRGHIIAIDPNTTTAVNETYDLGSTEYRWRTGYFREIDIKANTTTGQALNIVGDTAAGQGAFLIKQGGNTRARIGGGNQYVDLDTTTSQFDFKSGGTTLSSFSISKWSSNIQTSTGQWDFLLNGVTLTSIKINGLERNIIKKTTLITGISPTTSSWNVTNSSALISTLSITSNGHPIKIGFNLAPQTVAAYNVIVNTVTSASVGNLTIYRDGTAAGNQIAKIPMINSAKDTSTSQDSNTLFSPIVIDDSVTAGNHTYYCYGIINPGKFFINTDSKMQAIELI